MLDAGADRVIVGTAAVEHPDQLGEWLATLGSERLIVAVDAHGSRVASRGWQSTTELELTPFCKQLRALGVQRVLYTDIGRDGMLEGPNLEQTRAVAEVLTVLASGGVSKPEHLRELAEAGAEGAIIGSALYTGKLRLQEALAAC